MLFSLLILSSAILACSWNIDPETPEPIAILETPTVVHLPSITPTLRATPAPTLVPLVRIEDADRALFNGDWEMALLEYSAVYESVNGALGDLRRMHLRLYWVYNRTKTLIWASMMLRWKHSIRLALPRCIQLASAHFVSAQAYEALSYYIEAADVVSSILRKSAWIDRSYVLEWRGDVLAAAGNHQTAIDDYQSAMAAPRLDLNLPIELKIANSYAALGDYDTALLAYQDVYTRSINDYTKANVDIKIGNIYLELGITDGLRILL